MQIPIIRIGNSKGLRIPGGLLKQCKMTNTVNLKLEGDKIIITACKKERESWEEKFKLMAKNSEDELLDINFISNSWDDKEWTW